nr:VOC family protein [Neomicrococcus lactis]
MWLEAITKDFGAAKTFYEAAFGWTTDIMSDTEEFRYATLERGDEATAGLMDGSMFLEDAVPGFWQIYINVESVDETVAKLESLGGSVVEAAADTNFGRIAFVTDSTGARFRLHQHVEGATYEPDTAE